MGVGNAESGRQEPGAEYRFADVLYQQGQYAEALEILEDLDRRHPEVERLMLARALCLAALARWDEAIKLCDALVTRFETPEAVELKERAQAMLSHDGNGSAGSERRPRGRGRVLFLLAASVLLLPLGIYWIVRPPNVTDVGSRAAAQEEQRVTAAEAKSNPLVIQATAQLQGGYWHQCSAALAKLRAERVTARAADRLTEQLLQARQNFALNHSRLDRPLRVTCLDNPLQSYELYVPPSAALERSSILYVFSPAANGSEMLRALAPAAEKQGWIVAASNNSKNGPWTDIYNAQDAVLWDTEERLDLHPTRRFATGFSGGARASLAMAFRYPVRMSGVLAMGAGWPINTKLQPLRHTQKVYILIGQEDSNLGHDIPHTQEHLQAAGIECVTEVYPGGHVMPPPEMILAACDWLNASVPP